MKHYILAFTISVFCFSYAGAEEGWFWQNPIPQSNTIRGIVALSPDAAIAVGDAGTVLRTENGGENWVMKTVTGDTLKDLRALCFFDTLGWAVGEMGTVVKTEDGGKHWTSIKTGFSDNLLGVHFLDASHGWVTGARGKIARTTNGGKTWENLNGGADRDLYAVQFIDLLTGWAVGDRGTVLKTENGGTVWTPQMVPTQSSFRALYISDSKIGWISGTNGVILKTADGGNVWEQQPTFLSEELSDLYFMDDSTGYTAGGGGVVLKTVDGGQNWLQQGTGTGNSLRSLSFSGDLVGFAAGDYGQILKTDTGGDLWSSLLRGPTQGIVKLFFTNADTGVAAGAGEISKTTDSGVTWTPQPIELPGNASDFYFVNPMVGWVVGSKSMEDEGIPEANRTFIAKTTDGGVTWVQEYTNNVIEMRSVTLNSVYFYNAVYGWAVGRSAFNSRGIMLRTRDAGATWSYAETESYCNIQSVFAVDTKHVFAVGSVGQNGFIMISENGGFTWVFQNPSTTESFNSVFFSDLQNGWIIGGSGILLRTTNGGKDWTPQSLAFRDNMRSIFFVDRLNGWICGDNGLVLNSSDGGLEWTQQSTGTGNSLRTVHFVDSTTGWVAGTGGTILKTTNAGWKDSDDPGKNDKAAILSQNYPNPPLNQSTTFRFNLPDPGRTTLTLYDMRGRRIAVILDQVRAAGPYQFQWSTAGIPCGIYICRLESGKTTGTIKLVVVR